MFFWNMNPAILSRIISKFCHKLHIWMASFMWHIQYLVLLIFFLKLFCGKTCITIVTFERLLSFIIDAMCPLKLVFHAKIASQTVHLKDLVPPWIDAMCPFKPCFEVKPALQVSHLKGFWQDLHPQTSHLNVDSFLI